MVEEQVQQLAVHPTLITVEIQLFYVKLLLEAVAVHGKALLVLIPVDQVEVLTITTFQDIQDMKGMETFLLLVLLKVFPEVMACIGVTLFTDQEAEAELQLEENAV